MKRFLPWLALCILVVAGIIGYRQFFAPGADESPVIAPANAGQASEEDYRALVRDNTRFALDLHARLPRDGNLVTSPFAVSSVLAMLSAGARGETLSEMNKALRFSLAQQQLHPAFASLVRDLHSQEKPHGYTLHFANAVWTDQSIELLPDFLTTLDRNYSVSGHPVNFTNPEDACRAINDWASAQTQKQITEVIRPQEVHADTKLLLASAVSFRGRWQEPFQPPQTKDAGFTIAPGKTVSVPMMHQGAVFEYAADADEPTKETFQLVRLPFRGRQMEFVILLPRQVDGLAALEKNLTSERLDTWISRSRPHLVFLQLPRFRMGSRLSLVEQLKALGMKRAFDRDKADFSAIFAPVALHLDSVLQEAVIEVNEEGAKAAAVASAKAKDKGKGASLPVEFHADHPFLFLIRHPASGTILFLGRVSNPIG
jgi:serpin B